MSVFTIFCHDQIINNNTTKIFAMCSNEDDIVIMIKKNFCNFGSHINTTIMCHSKHENTPCVLWVNKYNLDIQCQYDKSYIQPNGSYDLSIHVDKLNDE